MTIELSWPSKKHMIMFIFGAALFFFGFGWIAAAFYIEPEIYNVGASK